MAARRGIRQRTLARALGKDPAWVSRRLSGGIALDVDELERLAAALECGVADFLPQSDKGRGRQQPQSVEQEAGLAA